MATQRAIDELFKKLSREAALIASIVDANESGRLFSFADYPMTRQRVDRLLKQMRSSVQTIVVNGIDKGWQLANGKNDALIEQYFGNNVVHLPPGQRKLYYAANEAAREAFKTRRDNGLNLSDRVWKYSDQFKEEIEMGIDIGLGDGLDADELSRRLRSYLREPNKLFRRVRDKYGNLNLSKSAAAYHPGRGVYRSSYKNARRLAATETNMAYRSADYERLQQLDFVVGIEVRLSNNHTLNGRSFRDICDELAGKYPKGFKFTGWHPHCRCHVVTILKTPDEVEADNERILNGEMLDEESVNQVRDVPDNFKTWVIDNANRIDKAKTRDTLPYFIQDNMVAVDRVINPPTALEVAKERHAARTDVQIQDIKRRWTLRNAKRRHANRTPEQEAAIRKAWNDRKATRKYGNGVLSYMNGIPDVDTSALKQALTRGNLEDILTEAYSLRDVGKEILSYKNLDNPMKVARQFSMAEAKAVNESVQKKLDSWTGLSLEKQKAKLQFEIGWVQSHQKYSTWEVAQTAYKKQLEKVSDALDWENIGNEFKSISSFKTKSQPYLDLVAKLQEAISGKDKAVAQQTILDITKKREQLEKATALRRKSKFKNQFGEDAYSQNRKDAAVWDKGDGSKADIALIDTAGENWRKATNQEKKYVYEYTSHYCDVNEPLQGRKYYSSQPKSRFIEKVNNITSYIEKNELPTDMWFTRGDDGLSVIRSRIEFAGGTMPSDLHELVGMVMQEGGFMSTGSRKGKGFSSRKVILNIYAPKGTKAAYLEPISAYGNGAGLSWDGIQRFTSFSAEHETLFQRGTRMRITRVYQENSKIYIDCEVVGQELKDLSYVKDSDIGL